MALNFIRLSVIYVLIGVGIGLYMAASHAFNQHPTHAHANLLGWASLALFGLIYKAYPALEHHILAKAHFWLYNLGLPVVLAGIGLIHGGNAGLGEPLAGIGSILVTLGFVALVLNLYRRLT